MGQYRWSFYFYWQLGFLLNIDKHHIELNLPFVKVIYGRMLLAKGVLFFGKVIKLKFNAHYRGDVDDLR